MLSMKFCIYTPNKKGWRFNTRTVEVIDINNPNMVFGKRENPRAITIKEYSQIIRGLRNTPNVSYKIIKKDMDI